MLKTKEVEIKWIHKTKQHYINKGYVFSGYDTYFMIRVEDIMDSSDIKVNVNCDNCDKNLNMKWKTYKKYVHSDGKNYCRACAHILFASELSRKTKLKNGISFVKWCIDNKYNSVLNLWDYKLNLTNPKDVSYASNKSFYFKCTNKAHKSELKKIGNITKNGKLNLNCVQCNSFAQWGIDNLGKDFLKNYWDYNKNNIDPFLIPHSWNKKVWIKCQEKDYHDNYEMACCNFITGKRCPYCSNKKIHKLDSLGYLFPEAINIWSDKNLKSPYEYSPSSGQKVWWKCECDKHEEYYRSINNTNYLNFSCPKCKISKGEKRIEDFIINNKIDYIAQKTFDALVGINSGLLSYDFYLPEYNILIEFQGGQHDRFIEFFHKTIKNFNKQQEHDRRKRQFSIDNNIKLLEIKYYEFDKIDEILKKELGHNPDSFYMCETTQEKENAWQEIDQ